MSKKEKEVPEEPVRLYLEYSERRTGGEPHDPNDRWTTHEDTNIYVSFKRLHRQQPAHRFFYDSVELSNPKLAELDKLYLAVVRYSTGNTFGHTEGAWYVVGVAPTYQIAEEMLTEATKPSEKGDYSRYKPWEGYFERLTDTEIHTMEVV